MRTVNSTKGLPAALRVVADNLNSAANDLARVLNSLASALEPDASETADSPPAGTGGKVARARATSDKKTSLPTVVTDDEVRAAMLELGPATSAEIAAHLNQSAGRRVVDGRAIRGHARHLGARVVMRRGQRLYRL